MYFGLRARLEQDVSVEVWLQVGRRAKVHVKVADLGERWNGKQLKRISKHEQAPEDKPRFGEPGMA